MARDLKEVSATGDVVAGPAYLLGVTVTAGADAASVIVKDGSSGSTRLTIKAPAGSTQTWRAGGRDGVLFGTAIHATLSGTSPVASFEFN